MYLREGDVTGLEECMYSSMHKEEEEKRKEKRTNMTVVALKRSTSNVVGKICRRY